jgi:hypothetical protein
VIANIDERLQKYFSAEFSDPQRITDISQGFRREGYVKITDLVAPDIKEAVREEVYRLLEHARRIEIRLKETSGTPRRMSTVGAGHINRHSPVICELYDSPALQDFLSAVAREPVVACPYLPERFVITKQDRAGDTHGWHWGDFSFAVIWIIEAPAIEFGGMLQCVPHTDWNKADPRVNEYLARYPIKTYHHDTGDIYFLRTDTTLHRTVPLTGDVTRIILNTAFATAADAERSLTHETMDALFDGGES